MSLGGTAMQTRARAAARLRLSLRIFESLRAGPPGRIPLLRAVLELRSDVSEPDHTRRRMICNEKGALSCLFQMGMLLEAELPDQYSK